MAAYSINIVIPGFYMGHFALWPRHLLDGVKQSGDFTIRESKSCVQPGR